MAWSPPACWERRATRSLVLDRNNRVGGCLRTEEITAPGFLHDVMATTLVLFLTSPAYGAIGKDLEARGFAVAHSDLPTGVLRPDGSYVLFSRDRKRNIATFDACAPGDGATFAKEMDRMGADAPFLFSLLGGQLWSRSMAMTIAREAWRRGPRALLSWFGEALKPSRNYLEATYASEAVHALWAPWGLHCGLNPESAYSAQMIKVIAFAVELAGCPIAVGGANSLLGAFERLIGDQGGQIRCGADVEKVLLDAGGRAIGVQPFLGRDDYGRQRGDLLGDSRAAVRPSAARKCAASRNCRRIATLPPRQRRHADPLCARRAATLEWRRGTGQGRVAACHPGPRRRVARGRRFAAVAASKNFSSLNPTILSICTCHRSRTSRLANRYRPSVSLR